MAFAFTALTFSAIRAKPIQIFLGKIRLVCQLQDSPQQTVLLSTSAWAAGTAEPPVCAAVPPQSQGSLFLRSLLYYAPPLLKKRRHLVCSVVEKVSFVLLHCLFVQWPAKGSVGSGGDSHCS